MPILSIPSKPFGRDHVFLPPLISLFSIEGNSHQFGKVENRKTHLLPHLQIGLAETAGSHHTLGPRFLCPLHNFPTIFFTISP